MNISRRFFYFTLCKLSGFATLFAKRRIQKTILTTSLFATFSALPLTWSLSVATTISDEAATPRNDDAYAGYVGSNARWLVDKRHGVVYAWELEENRPLWSSDGVVFRASPYKSDAYGKTARLPETFDNATEIFGRLYFLLDEIDSRSLNNEVPNARRDQLLVALAPKEQGRLVWRRRAQDFAPFFTSQTNLRFTNGITPLPNDELLVKVQAENETIPFALNAATGEARRLEANPTPRLPRPATLR